MALCKEICFVSVMYTESVCWVMCLFRRLSCILHSSCIFFQLQVPLVIFKREKEVARKLEFDGLYITEQPSEDDIKGQWDRLVINTQ